MKFCENLFNEITKTGVLPPPYKITWYAKNCAYIEGAINLLSIKADEITVIVKGGNLVVKGKGLYVSSYSEQDLLISGKISEIKSIEKDKK